MKAAAIIAFFFLACPCALLAKEELVSNVYNQVSLIFKEDGGLGTRRLFGGVAGGDGFMWGSLQQPFLELVPVVSNNYVQIAEDWNSYGTNIVVSHTVLTAIGFSGINVYTNFTAGMLSRYEQTQSSNDWKVVRFLAAPFCTPLEQSISLFYDEKAVSNLFIRIRTDAINQGDQKIKAMCDDLLSGKTKEALLRMKALGVYEW